MAGRLNSPKFLEKAPEAVVEKSKKELSDLEDQLAAVTARVVGCCRLNQVDP